MSSAVLEKEKASHKDAKLQRYRKDFPCGTFAALRLCVNYFCLESKDFNLNRLISQMNGVRFVASRILREAA